MHSNVVAALKVSIPCVENLYSWCRTCFSPLGISKIAQWLSFSLKEARWSVRKDPETIHTFPDCSLQVASYGRLYYSLGGVGIPRWTRCYCRVPSKASRHLLDLELLQYDVRFWERKNSKHRNFPSLQWYRMGVRLCLRSPRCKCTLGRRCKDMVFGSSCGGLVHTEVCTKWVERCTDNEEQHLSHLFGGDSWLYCGSAVFCSWGWPWLGIFLWGCSMSNTGKPRTNLPAFEPEQHAWSFYSDLVCLRSLNLSKIPCIRYLECLLVKRSLRAIATFGGFIKLTIYYVFDTPAGPWFESPMCKFYIGLTLTLDIIYPCLYYVIRRQEKRIAVGEKKVK